MIRLGTLSVPAGLAYSVCLCFETCTQCSNLYNGVGALVGKQVQNAQEIAPRRLNCTESSPSSLPALRTIDDNQCFEIRTGIAKIIQSMLK